MVAMGAPAHRFHASARACWIVLGVLLAPGMERTLAADAGESVSGYCKAHPAEGTRRAGDLAAVLPGWTRSVVTDKYALVTPESQVLGLLPGWTGVKAACVISPAMGAKFSMYLVEAKEGEVATGTVLDDRTERFLYVIEGSLSTPNASHVGAGGYMYIPPHERSLAVTAAPGSRLLIYDRHYSVDRQVEKKPELIVYHQQDIPVEFPDGEVFELRRLLPTTSQYDFNVHVMDFKPGEYLNVKEVHYNEHGLLLLEGMGIYRLGDDYFPVTAGDVIYMAPFVPQWFAALGYHRSRYIIYKDTNRDPLV